MNFETTENHNDLIVFYRKNGLEVSDDIKAQDGAVLSLVYKDNGSLLAAATLSVRQDIYILDYIAVDESLRRSGVGSTLLKEMLSKAKALNAKHIYLTARNPEFFKSQGFSEGSPQGVDMNADCIGCPQFANGCTKLPMAIEL